MRETFALKNVRHELIESAGQNVQQCNAHNAERFARGHRILGVGQMQHNARGRQLRDLQRVKRVCLTIQITQIERG